MTASIGIASGDRECAGELLRDADVAMYQAKWDGRHRHVAFDSGMQTAVQTRMELEMDLRMALENDEFFLLYQPTLRLHDMSPTGMEALIRWNSTTRGVVQPDDFISLLEETGLIIDIGRWVLREACCQGVRWRESGYPIGIAVNVSARQLESDEFVIHAGAATCGELAVAVQWAADFVAMALMIGWCPVTGKHSSSPSSRAMPCMRRSGTLWPPFDSRQGRVRVARSPMPNARQPTASIGDGRAFEKISPRMDATRPHTLTPPSARPPYGSVRTVTG